MATPTMSTTMSMTTVTVTGTTTTATKLERTPPLCASETETDDASP